MEQTTHHHLKHKKILPYVLCVEGNIGSGKSTLLTNLSKHGFTVIPEPVNDIWGQYLPQLYQDLRRWGFCFQMEAMDWFRQLQSRKFEHLLLKMKHTETDVDNEHKQRELSDDDDYDEDDDLVNMQCEDQENKAKDECMNRRKNKVCVNQPLLSSSSAQSALHRKVIIVERSALSAITIFAKNLLDTGLMTEWEYSLLERFYSMIAWEPGHILYLRVDPDVCYRRIEARNRNGEGNVDPVLIRNLHNKHERMFGEQRKSNTKQHVLREKSVNQVYEHGISAASQNIILVDGRQNAENVLQETLRKIAKM